MKDKFGNSVEKFYLLFLLAVGMFLTCKEARAAQYFLVRELSVEAGKYTAPASVREPYLNTPREYELTGLVNLNWDVDLACIYGKDMCLYWDNTIYSKSSQAAFKYVSWGFEVGAAFKMMDVYYFHKSQHVMEEERAAKVFPVEDAIMLRLKFINDPRRG